MTPFADSTSFDRSVRFRPRTRPCGGYWLLLLLSLGCGGSQLKTYPVNGTVLFDDGSPVRTGTIELESIEHGVTATGKIQPDGSFVLGTFQSSDGAVAGRHRVIVVQMVIADGLLKHTVDHGLPVPVHYNSYETSGLQLTIEPQPTNNPTITLER